MPPAIRPLLGLLLLCTAMGVRAQISVTPTTASFGEQFVNIESAPVAITVRNDTFQLFIVRSWGPLDPAFTHVGGSCGEAAFFSVFPLSECTLLYTFRPSFAGPRSSAVELSVSGGNDYTFDLSGEGVHAPFIVTPGVLLFSSVAVGTSSALPTQLRNVGTSTMHVTSITPASAPFTHVGGSCGELPITLEAGGSCTLEYRFTPSAVGDASQQLSIGTSLSASSWSLALEGRGEQGSQTIDFPAQAARTYSAGGSFAIDPEATASSGLAVSYGSATPSVCTTSGSTVAIMAAGICTLTADQAGNASWAAAAQQTRSFAIERARQVLTFPVQSTARRSFGAGDSFAIAPLATSAAPNSGQGITYSALDDSVCTVAGTTVTMLSPGTCRMAANQAGDANHHAAAQVTTQVQLVDPDGADLWVDTTSDVTRASDGDTLAYTIRVGNHGGADAAGVQLLVLPPDRLGDVVWTCVEAIGSTCPDPSADDGGIDVSIDLPENASMRFELLGVVLPSALPDAGAVVVETTASASLPAGSLLTDPAAGNNESAASVIVWPGRVHADGFELLPQR